MYYVYILKSQKFGTLYTGRTTNLKHRYASHQTGSVKSTKHKRPLVLIFYEAFISNKDAIRRERYLKTTKGKSSLKQIIRDSLQ